MALNINDTEARRQYTATSGQTVFSVPFTFFEVDELKVYNGSTLLTYDETPDNATEYSVTGADSDLGGSITLGAPGATLNDVITIVHDVPVERITDFPLSGPFQIESLNEELSKIVAMIRQQWTAIDRKIGLSDTDITEIPGDMPEQADRAGKYLAFDGSGNPVASTGTGADAGLRTDLAASDAAALVGFLQAGTGAVARTAQAKLRDIVCVDDFGAAGDNTTDDTAAIQACFDAHPDATVTFGAGKTYRIVGTITLVNASGKNFQGNIDFQGATINFVTTGSSAATDANMANGFVVYPTLNATGGDITGLRQSVFRNGTINGPANGASIRLANSQNVTFDNIRTVGNRYGIAEESCINTLHQNCTFEDYHNAGVGLLATGNSSIWYRVIATSWWNDGHTFISCGFKNSLQTQPAAHILDHGSASLPQRKAIGCYFYSRWDGYVGTMISTQFGIVSRNGAWDIDSCWFENVARPVRILEENSLEPTDLNGVAGAQPSGTYAIASFPNGYSYAYSCRNCTFARAFVEQEINGVRGVARLTGNTSIFVLNGATIIKSVTTSTSQVVMDDGTTIVSPQGSYGATSFVDGFYVDPKAQWQTWSPTITPSSGTITTLGTVSCKYTQRGKVVQVRGSVTITTNGTGAGALQISLPVTAATDGGAASGRERAITGALVGGQISGSQITLTREGNLYPGANDAIIVFSGIYEAV